MEEDEARGPAGEEPGFDGGSRDERILRYLEMLGGGSIGSGIAKALAGLVWDLNHPDDPSLGEKTLLHDFAAAYAALKPAGIWLELDPLLAHVKMARRFGIDVGDEQAAVTAYLERRLNGADHDREDFIGRCRQIAAQEGARTPKLVAGHLMGLTMLLAEYRQTGGAVDAERRYDALNDAFIAMMTLRLYYRVREEDLLAAEDALFSE